MKTYFFILLTIALTWQSFAQPAVLPQYLFVLDASGSMWQTLNGEYKVAIAKKVLNDLVQKLPADSRAGLIAYGHSRKSDCDDIETLLPLATLDRAAFTATLNAINPQGKTPIAKSLQHALASVQTQKEPVNIILVSDGLETCEGNACEVVRIARHKGVQITLHVVGFGIQEQDISALECIAQAGGGQYLPASNAGELSAALDKTVELPDVSGGYLSLKVTMEGKLVDAMVKVFPHGVVKETAIGRTYDNGETNPRILLLPPGEYRAEVVAIQLDGKPTLQLTQLQITEGDTLYREIDFAKGTMEILVTRNGALSDAVVVLFRSGTREIATQTRTYDQPSTNPVILKVLPGTYDLEIRSVEIEGKPQYRIEKEVVTGGAQITLARHFASGELKVGARQGNALVDATVSIKSKTNGASVASGRTYQTADNNPKTFILEPGEYEVRIQAVKPKELGTITRTVRVNEKGISTVTAEW